MVNNMATVLDGGIKDLGGSKQRKFVLQKSFLTDETAQRLAKKLKNGPLWANEIEKDEYENDIAIFRLYKFEELGIVSSKVEQKNTTSYERKFKLTDFGKSFLNH